MRVTCFRSVCDRQRGIALLYVLLIFSMIALMASQLVVNLLSYTEKNARFIERVQAKNYAFGAEQYVALLLEADFQEDKRKNRQVDHEQERWNVSGVDYEIDEGHIDLVETLSYEILSNIFSDNRASKVWLKIEKLDVFKEAESVGLEILKTRKNFVKIRNSQHITKIKNQ